MMAHTKGPWKTSSSTLVFAEEPEGVSIICNTLPILYDSGMTLSKATANARLIAAAPELLKELKILVAIIEPCLESGLNIPGLATLNAAKAIISKAEGCDNEKF